MESIWRNPPSFIPICGQIVAICEQAGGHLVSREESWKPGGPKAELKRQSAVFDALPLLKNSCW